MKIKEFIDNLSIQEYNELEQIVLRKLEEKDAARLRILAFIKENEHDISRRITNGLYRAADEVVYFDLLTYKRLLSYEQVGKKSLTDFEQFLKGKGYDRLILNY
jgi:hypothetical protein